MITGLDIPGLPNASQTDNMQAAGASGIHGVIGGNLTGYLFVYLQQNKIGWLFNAQTDFAIANVGTRRPDVAFVSREKLAAPPDEEVPFAPNLAVEVISRTDDWSEIAFKANQYTQAGTQLVWAVDPYTHSVFVFRPNQPMTLLNQTDELDGADVLPNFKLLVEALFG